MNNIRLTYISDGCFKYTFDAKKVLAYVQDLIKPGYRVLNLFAGKNRVCDQETRVDLSSEFHPDYCMSAEEFLNSDHNTKDYDIIIWDPPWNERKAKEFYDGRYIGKFTKLKDMVIDSLRPCGIVISCGYEITNFGKKRGMELSSVAVINPHGEIRPYFIVTETKVRERK